MVKRQRTHKELPASGGSWPASTELVGLVFDLQAVGSASVVPQYAVGLHAWFLDQVRSIDPQLSAYLHDGESEKPFTVSGLEGNIVSSGRQLLLEDGELYQWYVSGLSRPVVDWMQKWVENLPDAINLRDAVLRIKSVGIAYEPLSYQQLWEGEIGKAVALSFVSPTSFRRKGHHLPMPWPVNVFHSYLRRWNNFSGMPFDQESFLEWIDENVIIRQLRLESVKVAAGKKGMVTGFTGAIEYGLGKDGGNDQEFERLFYALLRLAPYSGTGHKTTFGLGQTRLGWLSGNETKVAKSETLLGERIEDLTQLLMSLQKRTGGERAQKVCELRATILARQEFGESLQEIAQDLALNYETVKTYNKLARRALKEDV